MSSVTVDVAPIVGLSSGMPQRLLVTVRPGAVDGRHRLYQHVGYLSQLADHYEFIYVDEPDGIRPLPGFPDLNGRYQSPELFPLFSERILSARRPDRGRYLDALELNEASEPWEILVRSGGRRAGDTIEVIPEPTVSADGETCCTFLVHGVRHQGPRASDEIARLQPGDELVLVLEPDNPKNQRAVLVTSRSGTSLGYVPDPLVDYVQTVLSAGGHCIRVVTANGPEVGPHLRLLVRLDGSVPPGYRPF